MMQSPFGKGILRAQQKIKPIKSKGAPDGSGNPDNLQTTAAGYHLLSNDEEETEETRVDGPQTRNIDGKRVALVDGFAKN